MAENVNIRALFETAIRGELQRLATFTGSSAVPCDSLLQLCQSAQACNAAGLMPTAEATTPVVQAANEQTKTAHPAKAETAEAHKQGPIRKPKAFA